MAAIAHPASKMLPSTACRFRASHCGVPEWRYALREALVVLDSDLRIERVTSAPSLRHELRRREVVLQLQSAEHDSS